MDDSDIVFINWSRLWELFLCCSRSKILLNIGTKARVLLQHTGRFLKGTARKFRLKVSHRSSVLPCWQLWLQKEQRMKCFGAESSHMWQQIASFRCRKCWVSHAGSVTKHISLRMAQWNWTPIYKSQLRRGSVTHVDVDIASILWWYRWRFHFSILPSYHKRKEGKNSIQGL